MMETFCEKDFSRRVAFQKVLMETIASITTLGFALPVIEVESPGCRPSMEASATAQRKHGPDFSPQHEFHRAIQFVLRDFPGGNRPHRNIGACAFALFHAAKYFSRTAGSIQSQTSCGRRRH